MTFDKVKEIVIDTLNCDEEAVTLNASLTNDLGADSLDGVELVMALEEAFGMDFPEDAAIKFKTVEDIVHYIEENK